MNALENIINNKENYIADKMGEIQVDNKTYKDYENYMFTWEKTYVEPPERSNNGSMGDLNNLYATFVTPRLVVKYSVMSITDYRSIMEQYLSKNEFIVKCYDPIKNEITTNKMYFGTMEEPNYYVTPRTDSNGEKVVDLMGVKNFTIELIGTNNPLNE